MSVPATPAPAGTPARNPALDVLRGVAVLAVLAFHSRFAPAGWPEALGRLQSGGWLGVDLFFVLSGYLVGGLLFAEYRAHGALRPGRFLIRRAFKIYPSFWVLILFLVASRVVQHRTGFGRELAAELAFVQNYFPGLRVHTWSLAVEEHYYLLLAGVLGVLAWRGRGTPDPFRAWPVIVGLLALACLGLRLAAPVPTTTVPALYAPTHLRLDSLAIGSLLAYAHHFHAARLAGWRSRHGRRVAAILSLPLVILWFSLGTSLRGQVTWGFTVSALAFASWVWLALPSAAGPIAPVRPWLRPLAWVGTWSYPIYLWHLEAHYVAQALRQRLPEGWPREAAFLAAYVGGSLLAGWLLGRLVERPFLRLRDRWFPSRRPAA